MRIGDRCFVHGYIHKLLSEARKKQKDEQAVKADAINNTIPTAQSAEVVAIERSNQRKKGEWISEGDIPTKCPFCGEHWNKYIFGTRIWYTGELPKFCPECGADMKGE